MTRPSKTSELFRNRVREEISKQGKTISTVASDAEISFVHLSRVLSGKADVSMPIAEQIADALDIPLHQMLTPNQAIENDNDGSRKPANIETTSTMDVMVGKSTGVTGLYDVYIQRIRQAIDHAVANGDSVSSIASRVGISRGALNAIRNGTYTSVLNAVLLIAFDLEFNLNILNREKRDRHSKQTDNNKSMSLCT